MPVVGRGPGGRSPCAGGPVSLMAWPGVPPVAELERLGVARVSFGPGTQGLAMAALARGVEEILQGGSLPADLGFRTPAR